MFQMWISSDEIKVGSDRWDLFANFRLFLGGRNKLFVSQKVSKVELVWDEMKTDYYEYPLHRPNDFWTYLSDTGVWKVQKNEYLFKWSHLISYITCLSRTHCNLNFIDRNWNKTN